MGRREVGIPEPEPETEDPAPIDAHPVRRLIEACLPVAAIQAWVWSLGPDRTRLLDAAFGVALGALVAILAARSRPNRRTFGVAAGPEHRKSAFPLAIFTLLAVGGLLAWGDWAGRLRIEFDLVSALAAYPAWAALQMAAVLGFVYPRIRALSGRATAPFLTALLFGSAHAPNLLLMGGGFVMVAVYAAIWERHPSLPAVALSHGIIGAVCNKALHVSMRIGPGYFL